MCILFVSTSSVFLVYVLLVTFTKVSEGIRFDNVLRVFINSDPILDKNVSYT